MSLVVVSEYDLDIKKYNKLELSKEGLGPVRFN